MDSLQDIIAKYGKPEQPELLALRQYIDLHYHTPVSIALSGNAIVITVPSASLANTLRLHSTQMTEACEITKRLIFRIG